MSSAPHSYNTQNLPPLQLCCHSHLRPEGGSRTFTVMVKNCVCVRDHRRVCLRESARRRDVNEFDTWPAAFGLYSDVACLLSREAGWFQLKKRSWNKHPSEHRRRVAWIPPAHLPSKQPLPPSVSHPPADDSLPSTVISGSSSPLRHLLTFGCLTVTSTSATPPEVARRDPGYFSFLFFPLEAISLRETQ